MTNDGKEKIDKNGLNKDLESPKDKLSSLKKEVNNKRLLEKGELKNLKKEVIKEKNTIELKNLKNQIERTRKIDNPDLKLKDKINSGLNNVNSSKYEKFGNFDLQLSQSKNDFMTRQVANFKSWKDQNESRPVEGIQSSYLDVVNQIEEGVNDRNIFARGLARIIKTIMHYEK